MVQVPDPLRQPPLPPLTSPLWGRGSVRGARFPTLRGLKHGHGPQMRKHGASALQPVLLAGGTLSNGEFVTAPRASPVPSALQWHSCTTCVFYYSISI